jgi:ABC-type thiamine transport system substrate-binding protein
MVVVVAGTLAASTRPVGAQGGLNVYCSVQLEWCQAIANEFARQSGIKVAITQKGSGEVFAQIKAEAANPRADVWFGGTGDPHLQAAEEGLTAVYKSPNLGQLHPWAVRQAEQSGYRTVGIMLAGRVSRAAFVGRAVEYAIATAAGELFVVTPDAGTALEPGAPVSLSLSAGGVTLVE